MTTFLEPGAALLDIPDLPDRARMYREIGARLRAAMKDKGVDALVLLGNGNVVYATGASWPLLDAGLSHVERPVAIVLADDEHPHLFMPFREGAALESELPADHVHGPLYLEFDEGVEHFAQGAGRTGPAGCDGRGRRADRCDAARGGPAVPRRAAVGCRPGGRSGQAGRRRPTRSPASARRAGSPRRPSSTCRSRWRPACARSTCRRSSSGAHSNSAPPRTCSRPSGR